MKSITPVISVILLILITIVASASAFFFINSSVLDLQSRGSIDAFPGSDNSRLNLVSITGSKALVRNDGTDPVTEMVVFINGELLNFTLDPPIMPGEVRQINYTAQDAGEDLDIKILYNGGKVEDGKSPANVNTESSGFIEISNPDSGSETCLINNINNTWFIGEINGSNYYCCGDDSALDDFFNLTNYCCNGYFNNGNCFCGDGLCQSFENQSNCLLDCYTTCSESSCSYSWNTYFTGAVASKNSETCACCGDEGFSDNFYNSSSYCAHGYQVSTLDTLFYGKTPHSSSFTNSSGSNILCELSGKNWFSTNISFAPTLWLSKGASGTYTGNNILIYDFNEDSFNDLLVNEYMDKGLTFFESYGNGSFKTGVFKATVTNRPYYLINADFDKDGHTDLVYFSSNYLCFFEGYGNGSFVNDVCYSTVLDVSSYNNIVSDDFNNDGNLDVIVSTYSSGMSLGMFLGYGNGSFSSKIDVTPGLGYLITSLVSGDFNNDGNIDLVGSDFNFYRYFYWGGYGNGSFYNYSGGVGHGFTANALQPPAIGDFNNDGFMDFVISDAYTSEFSFFKGYGNGSFYPDDKFSGPGYYGYFVPMTGDINNDGNLDITISTASEGRFEVFLGNGLGSFTRVFEGNDIPYRRSKDASMGDIDKDGDLDFAMVNSAAGEIFVIYNYGLNTTSGIGPCCETADTFTNGTHSCCNGIFQAGSCP